MLPLSEVITSDFDSLHLHQLDGLRFLHRQFKCKKQGVIINYPSGCGKTTLITVFLQTICKLLKEPVLILCNEDELLYWKETIIKWSKFVDDDIITDSPNPNTKNKKIFIKPIKDCPFTLSYVRRKWSIVIVKDEVVRKKMLSTWTSVQSDFKIWLTSVDMLKDLSMLAMVCSWINPSTKFNVDEFTPVEDKIKRIHQTVRLETTLEYLLYRNNSVKEFSTTKEIKNDASQLISRKNKDSTGSKVKRSKRRLCDETILPNTEITASVVKNVNACGRSNIKQRRSTLNNENSENLPTNIDTNFLDPDAINVGHIINDNHLSDNESQSIMNFDSALEDVIANENIPQHVNTNEMKENSEIATCEHIDNSSINNNVTIIIKEQTTKENISPENRTTVDVLSGYIQMDKYESLNNDTEATNDINTSLLDIKDNDTTENRPRVIENLSDKHLQKCKPLDDITLNTSIINSASVAEVENKTVNSATISDVLTESQHMETCEHLEENSGNVITSVINSATDVTLKLNKPTNSLFLLEDIIRVSKEVKTKNDNDTVIKNELKSEDNLEIKNTQSLLECNEVLAKSDIIKNVTDKLNDLEESTMKKFKGSLLDSIF